MVRYVYIDILFATNLAVNYIILMATGRLAGRRIVPKRLALASIVGSLYAAVHLLLPWRFAFSLPARLVFGILMVFLAYPGTRGTGLVILAACFYLASAVAAGTAYALLNSGGTAIFGNSVFTGDDGIVRWWVVAFSLAILSGFPIIAAAGGLRPGRKLPLLPVELIFSGTTIPLTGLVDTGNNLRDPVSGLPVVVVDWESVKRALPREAAAFFSSTWESVPDNLTQSPIGRRVRLIPYDSVTGKRGVLPAFRPDGFFITGENGEKVMRNAIVGISPERLSPSGLFQVLLHPDLVSS